MASKFCDEGPHPHSIELKKLQKDVNKAVNTYQDRLPQEALAAAEAKAKESG